MSSSNVSPAGFDQGVIDLSAEFGVLKVHGVEAAQFLQAQLTSDVQSLRGDGFRLAGYCTPKGRLLASFWVWRDPPADGSVDTFWLACSRGLAAAVARRLAMYVLRAKVKVENVSDTTAVLGRVVRAATDTDADAAAVAATVGDAAVAGAPRWRPLSPVAIAAPMLALLPELPLGAAATLARAVAIVAADPAPAPPGTGSTTTAPLPAGSWQRLEVLSAIARIVPENQELFVPQMVNFERVGGVDFRKGCYPGQEVVARSQYLGKLKRRSFLGRGEGPAPLPGSDVAAATAAPEPIGQVVNAAALADGAGFVVLFESRSDAVGDGPAAVRIDGRPVALLPLPYTFADPPASPAAAGAPAADAGGRSAAPAGR
ncbi:MAG: folate-binding protein YgfZ [Lautropia sp.]